MADTAPQLSLSGGGAREELETLARKNCLLSAIPKLELQRLFPEEVDRYSTVNRCVRRYIGFFLTQLQLLTACNRHHSVEQRGARWLLSLQDRTGSRDLCLTQQHLADMPGVSRQSADRLLDEFQISDIVETGRGIVTIKNRSKLLARACDCYHLIAERLEAVFAA